MTDRGSLRKVLGATILGSSLVFLDSTIVNVLLAAVQRDFALSLEQLRWLTQAYLLTLSTLLLLGGSLGDHLGRKRTFLVGISVFVISSLACAVAPSFGILVAARTIQGIGGALLTPGSLAIINAVFPKEERGRAIGAWASFTTLAVAAGPLVGGFLVDHLSWRWAFALNLPFAFASWYLTRMAVPETCSEQHSAPLDFMGAGLATLSLCGLTFGLMQQLSLLSLVSFFLFLAFLIFEKKAQSPMLPLMLFRDPVFAATNLLTFFVYGALGIIMFLLPLQIIEVSRQSAWRAGVASFPFISAIFILSRFAGKLMDSFGPSLPLTAGPLIVGGGALLLREMARPEISYTLAYLFPMFILGVGMAITITPLTTAVMASAGETYSGTASGINNTVARLSGLLGIAILPILLSRVAGLAFQIGFESFRAALIFAASLAFVGAGCGIFMGFKKSSQR